MNLPALPSVPKIASTKLLRRSSKSRAGYWRRPTILFLGLLFCFALPGILMAATQSSGLSAGQSVAVAELTKQISSIEWLAPLAPIALSPFFGITLLSGLALYGPEWLPDNALLGANSPLANPAIFWIFLVLTVTTSLPRLSKVSKPLAQFADFLETYSAIIVLVGMKLATSITTAPDSETAFMVQAGIFQVGMDGLIAIAMAVNIVVINAVKFFFEFLVWITPIPLLDAGFEAANKALCAALMGLYAYSPILALCVNIGLFLICLYVFGWARKREIFFRTTVTDYVLGFFNKKRGSTPPASLTVFPAFDTGAIKRRSKCSLVRTDAGLQLTQSRWLRSSIVEQLSGQPVIEKDWWTNSVNLPNGVKLTFTSRYNACLPELATSLGGSVHEAASQLSDTKHARQIEFS